MLKLGTRLVPGVLYTVVRLYNINLQTCVYLFHLRVPFGRGRRAAEEKES